MFSSRLIAALLAAAAVPTLAVPPNNFNYHAGGNKHSRHTVAQDKRAARKARNRAR